MVPSYLSTSCKRLAESHPNATYDDLWDVHIAYYSACRVAEAITQAGNW